MKVLFCVCFILIIFVCSSRADIKYQSLLYGVPINNVLATNPVYFNTSLHASPTFLVFYLSTPTIEPYLCASSNPAPDPSNCEYKSIARHVTSTIEIWIDSPQEGQILYVAVLGIGIVTLSNSTNIESLPLNSMNLYELDFTVPPSAQVWFQYSVSAPYDTYWFYPVICTGNNSGSFFEFVAYPLNTSDTSDGPANCGDGSAINIQSTQIDLPANEYNNYLLQQYLCDNMMFSTQIYNPQLGTTLYVSLSSYDTRIVGDTRIKLYYWKSNSSAGYMPNLIPQNLLLTPVSVYRNLLLNFDSTEATDFFGFYNYTYEVWLFPYRSQSNPPACSIISNPNSTTWSSHKLTRSTDGGYSREITTLTLLDFKANLPPAIANINAYMTVIMTLPNGLPFAYVPVSTWLSEPVLSAPSWSTTSLTVLLALALALALSGVANVIMLYRIMSRQSQYVQLTN